MPSIRIVLDTSDFSVELHPVESTPPQKRINAMIYGPNGETVELDLDPIVADDLANCLMNPEDPS